MKRLSGRPVVELGELQCRTLRGACATTWPRNLETPMFKDYIVPFVVLLLFFAGTVPAAAQEVVSETPERALLDRYCVTCHNDRVRAGELVLEGLDVLAVHEAPETWETVVRKLRAGAMPPPSRPRPEAGH